MALTAAPLVPAPPRGPYPAAPPVPGGFNAVLPSTIGAWQNALQVDLEDCVAAPSVTAVSHLSPRAAEAPAAMSPPRSARRSRSQEVAYVQRVGDPSHFRAMGHDATKRLGRPRTEQPEDRRRRAEPAAGAAAPLDVAVVSAASQVEVLALARDGEDQEIFELSVATERSRLLYRVLAALLQGVLLGLLVAAVVAELEMTDLSSANILAPLRGAILAMVEACLALNILRACEGYEHSLGRRLDEEETRDGRRRAWAAVANAAVLGVLNVAVLLCCLLSEMLDNVQSTMLQIATVFGIIAIWPALLDLLQVASQPLPEHVLMALLRWSKSGHAQSGS